MSSQTVIDPLLDFPDRISPMVVKELRQGLRTRVFGGVMLTLHLLLVVITLMSGAAANASEMSGLFDTIITAVLCIILPLRGFSALAEEIKANTLDMLVLTRLSAWRIVLGKWAAIASQSLLIAISLLPYVVSRYVFGGLNLLDEVGALGLKWLLGAVFAAGIVCLSTQRQFWLRAMAVGIPVVFGSMGLMTFMLFSSFGGSSSARFAVGGFTGLSLSALGVVAICAWLIFFFLSVGATRIAPPSSQLAVLKRSVHFTTFCVVLGFGALTGQATILEMAAAIAFFATVDALVERVCEVPSVYAAFYRKGTLGSLGSWFLTSGWASGMLFSLVPMLLFSVVAYYQVGWPAVARSWFSLGSVWMVAVLLQISPARRNRDLLGAFLAISLLLLMVTALMSGVSATFAARSLTPWHMAALPGTAEVGIMTAQTADQDRMRFIAFLCSLIWPAVLLLLAFIAFRKTRAVRAEARLLIQEVA